MNLFRRLPSACTMPKIPDDQNRPRVLTTADFAGQPITNLPVLNHVVGTGGAAFDQGYEPESFCTLCRRSTERLPTIK
jgi:hypothetical protein